MKCSQCDESAVTCIIVREGEKPDNPKHLNTQADRRRVVVVRQCANHATK